MPYTSEFVQIVVGGNILSNEATDEWQIGFKVPITSGFNNLDPNMTAVVQDCYQDVIQWWIGVRGFYSPQTTFSRVKANICRVDGKYKNQAKTFRVDEVPTPGSASSRPLPAEVAFAVTLLTDSARGLANKGRVYLPAPASSALDPNGRVAMPEFGNIVTGTLASLITNLGNLPGVDQGVGYGDVSVMSKVRLGATNKVTGVRSDNVWDTQRRRGNTFRGVLSARTAVT